MNSQESGDVTALKIGEFDALAEHYSASRPDYSPAVLDALIGILARPVSNLDFADVGAGTGIWTKMVSARGPHTCFAIEPSDDMRAAGIADSGGLGITWSKGSAEATGLRDGDFDWVTMASSFHWANFEVAIGEFKRILRPGGWLTTLWNPRLVSDNPLLIEIEEHIAELKPGLVRVSSGSSGITHTLTDRLWGCGAFRDVVYVEGRHKIHMSPTRYLNAWKSVNDLQVQLGPGLFKSFLSFVEDRVEGLDEIEATYLTRAWSAQTH